MSEEWISIIPKGVLGPDFAPSECRDGLDATHDLITFHKSEVRKAILPEASLGMRAMVVMNDRLTCMLMGIILTNQRIAAESTDRITACDLLELNTQIRSDAFALSNKLENMRNEHDAETIPQRP